MAFKFGKGKVNTKIILFSVITLTIILFVVLYVRQGHVYEGLDGPTAPYIADIPIPTNSFVKKEIFGTNPKLETIHIESDKNKFSKYGYLNNQDFFYNNPKKILQVKTQNIGISFFDYDYTVLFPDSTITGKSIQLTDFGSVQNINNLMITNNIDSMIGSLSDTDKTNVNNRINFIKTNNYYIQPSVSYPTIYLTFTYTNKGGTQGNAAFVFIYGQVTDIEKYYSGAGYINQPGWSVFFGLPHSSKNNATTIPGSSSNTNGAYRYGYFLRLIPTSPTL